MPSYIRTATVVALLGVGAAAVTAAVNAHSWVLPLVVGAVLVAALVGVFGWRAAWRAQLVDDLQQMITPLIGSNGTLKARRWRSWPGVPHELRIRYSPTAKLSITGELPELGLMLQTRLGIPLRIESHDPRRRRLIFHQGAVENDPQTNADETRFTRIITDLMGKDARLGKVERTPEGVPCRVEATSIPATKLAAAGYRRRVEATFSATNPGRWRCKWDLVSGRMTFEARPEFPVLIELPRLEVDPNQDILASYDQVQIPYGVDEDGNIVSWRPAIDPNLMVVGAPGTGKTVLEHVILASIAQQGWPIWVVDGKAVEFLGWRTWPNVQIVASRIEEQVAVIKRASELMEHRYALVDQGLAHEESFEPLMLFVDEWSDFRANLTAWYTLNKGKGAPAKPDVLNAVASIARKGRTARIHLLFATQRPDAEYFGGDMRDNFRARISMGRLSPQGAMMMWGDPAIGTTVPRGCRGRATTINDDNQAVEIQTYYVPDPRRAHSPDHLRHLETLRPKRHQYQRLLILAPTQAIQNGAPGYQAWCEAKWCPAASRSDLDSAHHSAIDPQKARELASPNALFGIPTPQPDHSTAPMAAPVAVLEAVEPECDMFAGYGPAAVSDPMGLNIGDLIEIEDGVWVTLNEPPEESLGDPGAVSLVWRSDDGEDGILDVGWSETINVCHPIGES